jgi:uncharacterized membrane protein
MKQSTAQTLLKLNILFTLSTMILLVCKGLNSAEEIHDTAGNIIKGAVITGAAFTYLFKWIVLLKGMQPEPKRSDKTAEAEISRIEFMNQGQMLALLLIVQICAAGAAVHKGPGLASVGAYVFADITSALTALAITRPQEDNNRSRLTQNLIDGSVKAKVEVEGKNDSNSNSPKQ